MLICINLSAVLTQGMDAETHQARCSSLSTR